MLWLFLLQRLHLAVLHNGMVLALHTTCLKYVFVSLDFKGVKDHK